MAHYRLYVDLNVSEDEAEDFANRFDAVLDEHGVDAEFNYSYMED